MVVSEGSKRRLSVKNRTVKKVEKRMLVDKVCELQREICEHERFEMDLLVMLVRGEESVVVKHDAGDFSGAIWKEVKDLIDENKMLAQKLKAYDEME